MNIMKDNMRVQIELQVAVCQPLQSNVKFYNHPTGLTQRKSIYHSVSETVQCHM
jgi:hypothetical protein